MLTIRILGIFAFIASAGVALADGTITLRTAATLPAGEVHLADIADLKGPEALALGDIVVSSGGSRTGTRITLEEITKALDHRPNINFGKLTFHGSACVVSLPAPKPVDPPAPAAVVPKGPTVRDMIPRRIADLLGVEPRKLRLKFEDNDNKLLDQPTTSRVVELKPVGAADRMPLQLSIYEDRGELGHTLIASGTIRVGVDVLRDVIIPRGQLKKGESITADSIGTDQQWLGFAMKPAAAETVVGSIVRAGKLNPGQAVMEADIEQAIAIKRGQLVTVHVITGTFVVKTQARALEAGRIGDVIKFSSASVPKDKKDIRTFEARIESSGRAIMTISNQTISPHASSGTAN